VKYQCIEARREHFPISMMCRLLQASNSGYYAWLTRPECKRAKIDRELIPIIKRLHHESGGIYVSPKIQFVLKDEGYHYGRHKVSRLMRSIGLRGCPKKRFKVTTIRHPDNTIAKNLLEQNFSVEQPNQCWVADITYINTNQGWLFLSIIMDLFSRKIVGLSMSHWLSRHLAIDALEMALNAFIIQNGSMGILVI
jgi:putative transposase